MTAIENGARVLVINVARIGDTLLVTPILRALKQSQANISLGVMAHPKRVELLQGLEFIDVLEGINKKSALLKGWLSGKIWDYAIVYGDRKSVV